MTVAEVDLTGSSDSLPERRETQAVPAVAGTMRPSRFTVGLVVIVAFGLAFRVGYVLLVTRHEKATIYDAFWYQVTGYWLRHGEFFRVPFGTGPSAAHPPMTSLIIGATYFLAGPHASATAVLLGMAVVGGAVVLCTGLLGRAVAGPWVGLIAALIAAFAPNFWMPSGILMSEAPAMLFMALILLAVVRTVRKPTVVIVLLLGAACGIEALVRAELILFVPTLLVPAVLVARQLSIRRRLLLVGLGVLAAVVVLAPWVGRNLATFQDPTYISTGDGLALLGANCPETYGGNGLGFWSLKCAVSAPGPGDESVQSARDQHVAVEYAKHHLGRLPMVALARIGRQWDLYRPLQMAHFEVNEGRPLSASIAGLWMYYASLALGIGGIVVLRRRRIDQWFLLVPAGVVTVVSALVYGLIRFRAPFEVCLAVLAAAAMAELGGAFARRRSRRRVEHPPM
jgi:4-amino-4-deoxy-L-arabinose transferase-like glycosyltransferase